MSKYVLLLSWTDQGIRNVKDTVKRAVSLRSYLEKKGGRLIDILYTFGQYDAIVTAELPNDEIAMSVSLGTGALGNVRVITLKAFGLDETKKIIGELRYSNFNSNINQSYCNSFGLVTIQTRGPKT